MIINSKEQDSATLYKVMSQTIIPRPIAWVVTELNGIVNIAPFSYFTALSSKPATCIISVGHKSDGEAKDTLKNIRESKKCTICMTEFDNLELMHNSAKELPSNISEADELKIKTKTIIKDYPPMIVNSPVAFVCSFNQEIEIGGKTIPLILNIEQIYLRDDITDENLNISYNPIARAAKGYAKLCDEIFMKRV